MYLILIMQVSRLGILLLKKKSKKGFTLLAFGASQGAQSINRLIQKFEDGTIRPVRWIVGSKILLNFMVIIS